jgi:hypothetical protein
LVGHEAIWGAYGMTVHCSECAHESCTQSCQAGTPSGYGRPLNLLVWCSTYHGPSMIHLCRQLMSCLSYDLCCCTAVITYYFEDRTWKLEHKILSMIFISHSVNNKYMKSNLKVLYFLAL